MSAKLTQRSLSCVEFVCTLELQEEHRGLFFSSLCCGGAAGNVKVISNCESFFRWRSSSRLAPGVRNLIIAHEPGTVRLRGLSLPKPSPLLSSSLVFFFTSVSWSIASALSSLSEEEINNMKSELEKYGIQMPAFSKIGGILANELSVDEAACEGGGLRCRGVGGSDSCRLYMRWLMLS